MMIAKQISKELNIKEQQSNAVIQLIDEGNTIPFIARYRKELTGSLDDEVLREFNSRLTYLRKLEERKNKILESINEQGKLNKRLREEIEKASTLVQLEDIYRPYKPKKRTRATIAKSKGLEPFANTILKQEINENLNNIGEKYLNEEVESIEDAINGAKDIIAEIVSDNAKFRKTIRENTYFNGEINIEAKDNELESEYEMYYEYGENISTISPHRVLAINRGEKENILKIKINTDTDEIIEFLKDRILKDNKYTEDVIIEAIEDSYKRLIAPSIERELRTCLKEKAEDKSIKVFSKNLEQLLLASPIPNKTILGWDPGFRTGCKIAVVDYTGKVLDTTVVFPTEPQNRIIETKKTIKDLIKRYNVDLISLGNGTASRESEKIISEILNEIPESNTKYVVVSEAGASVYSASKLASEEFPDYDVGERSAISIARRLQDPLAELVKIDPKSIGVGQYQHDMNQKKLSESLTSVVEKSVNEVGVDLNTSSVSLLNYVSGINKTLAKNIVKYREEHGEFYSREELKNVKKLGHKSFEQCAGFTKVPSSINPLDNTTVHPESYKQTEELLKSLNYSLEDIGRELKLDNINYEKLSKELNIGIPTLKDIVRELKKPGRDPREEMPQPILRSDVLEIEDLEEDMILQGTVRNVIDFGAFVDIGVHKDGLVHISQMVEDQFVKHPLDIVSVGDIIDVKIIGIDLNRRRIQLSMIL